ncbi:uncharacterized protein Z520_09193 [Fonsecaea multimorphosa CBS 102226]|uniref:Amino acid permease/ SLC12A domain-containing protein n=1 Tax=Fonsecaea multimorphosa CBS 102226 TaxID=1442371 RepID=A0A0D2IDQ6_9EURO|nr:uncharacterized protein Z520_09193 [Fonsecaea multimorphosa CBS 102226]KIX95276.1 hypothetical protein Z520_09193 [Fonsecaea multimorphosa CBS 102226]OAL17235.1 hypothetical protein AYO22_11800 [Fonsecaea multimorphosa]
MAPHGPSGIEMTNLPSRSPSQDGDEPPQTRPVAHAPLLGTYDVFSLIVNKMIGTGIYTNVSTVLVLTGDKGLTMTLWAIGSIYTLISMLIYLECSTVMPYNGGELVYLDELTSGRSGRGRSWIKRLLGDGLYAYCTYAFIFVAFFNSAANCLQIGRLLLFARNPEEDPDRDFLRTIAFLVLLLLCLLQYFSPQSGRVLNQIFAAVKIFLLLVVLCAGWHAIQVGTYPGAGFQQCDPPAASMSKIQVAKAFLLVIFSYEGWENATFVAGEIDPQSPVTLRKGFIFAVTVVSILYIAIVATFLKTIPYVPIAINYTPMLFGNNEAAYKAWSVFIAISSLGSLNSIIYTFSRIKQSIGSGNILPWSDFWKSDSPSAGHVEALDQYLAPRGGLVLHGIMTTVFIAASASIRTVLESVSMPGLIQTYAHCIILTIMGFAVLRLPSRTKHLDQVGRGDHNSDTGMDGQGEGSGWEWDLKLRYCEGWWRYVPASFCVVYGLANLWVVILSIIPPYRDQDGFPITGTSWSNSTDGKTLTCKDSGSSVNLTFPYPVALDEEDALQGWILPATTFGVMFFATCYYLAVFGSSQEPPFWRWCLTQWAGVRPVISKWEGYDWRLEQVRRFGRRRDIAFDKRNGNAQVGILYWLGGGSSLFVNNSRSHPVERWDDFWHRRGEAWHEFKKRYLRRRRRSD